MAYFVAVEMPSPTFGPNEIKLRPSCLVQYEATRQHFEDSYINARPTWKDGLLVQMLGLIIQFLIHFINY